MSPEQASGDDARRPQRPLLARHRPLSAADRAPRVHRREPAEDPGRGRPRHAAAALGRGRAPCARRRDRPGARQGARRPLPDRRGDGGGPRGRRSRGAAPRHASAARVRRPRPRGRSAPSRPAPPPETPRRRPSPDGAMALEWIGRRRRASRRARPSWPAARVPAGAPSAAPIGGPTTLAPAPADGRGAARRGLRAPPARGLDHGVGGRRARPRARPRGPPHPEARARAALQGSRAGDRSTRSGAARGAGRGVLGRQDTVGADRGVLHRRPRPHARRAGAPRRGRARPRWR